MELVLRFIALYTLDDNRPDDQNLDDFLHDTVETRCNRWSEDKWRNVEAAFYRALSAVRRYLAGLHLENISAPINIGDP